MHEPRKRRLMKIVGPAIRNSKLLVNMRSPSPRCGVGAPEIGLRRARPSFIVIIGSAVLQGREDVSDVDHRRGPSGTIIPRPRPASAPRRSDRLTASNVETDPHSAD